MSKRFVVELNVESEKLFAGGDWPIVCGGVELALKRVQLDVAAGRLAGKIVVEGEDVGSFELID